MNDNLALFEAIKTGVVAFFAFVSSITPIKPASFDKTINPTIPPTVTISVSDSIILENLELRNTQWKNGIFSGEVFNKADKPVTKILVTLRVSKDRESWSVDENYFVWIMDKISSNQSMRFEEKIKTSKIDPWWTALITSAKYYNSEDVSSTSFTRKLTPTTNTNTQVKGVNTTTNNLIDCVGPDNKEFKTTKEECVKLNAAWGKPFDEMIDCNFGSNCKEQSFKLKRSECDKATCCQIGDTWIAYSSSEKCRQDQDKLNLPISANTTLNNYPPCTVYYPALKYSQTYLYISPEQCQQWKDAASFTQDHTSATPAPHTTPTISPEQIQSLLDQIERNVARCKSEINSYYNQQIRNCEIQIGNICGSCSAIDACREKANNERNKKLAQCEQ